MSFLRKMRLGAVASAHRAARLQAGEAANHYRQFFITFLLFLGLFGVMAVGYRYIEGFSLYQSFLAFMANIGADWFTGGPPDGIPDQTPRGKLFSSFAALLAMVVGGYFISALTSFFIDGQLRDYLKINRMDKKIAALSGHYIVCGADYTTREVLEELVKLQKPVVVIYPDRAKIEELGLDVLYIDAKAEEDATLLAAGIERAAGLVASLDSDAENLYLVITARGLTPQLKIIAKVFDDNAATDKLHKAGADEVISPFHIGGLRIASLLLRPKVVSYLDKMLRGGDQRFAELTVPKSSRLVDRTITEADLHGQTGLNIISVQAAGSSDFDYNPAPHRVLAAGDTLIVIGTTAQLAKAEKLLAK